MTDMQIVAHRINTVERLRRLPAHWGVELDLRATAAAATSHPKPPLPPRDL